MFLRALLIALTFTLTLGGSAWARPHWTIKKEHLDWPTATIVLRTQTFHIPIRHPRGRITGYWTRTRQVSPHVRRIVRYPIYARTVPPALVGRTETWLVTYYLATGNAMANGIMPSVGWVACGNEIPLGTRLVISGLGGIFTCGDRIGFQPYAHVDVFGIPLASGYRTVTVLG